MIFRYFRVPTFWKRCCCNFDIVAEGNRNDSGHFRDIVLIVILRMKHLLQIILFGKSAWPCHGYDCSNHALFTTELSDGHCPRCTQRGQFTLPDFSSIYRLLFLSSLKSPTRFGVNLWPCINWEHQCSTFENHNVIIFCRNLIFVFKHQNWIPWSAKVCCSFGKHELKTWSKISTLLYDLPSR